MQHLRYSNSLLHQKWYMKLPKFTFKNYTDLYAIAVTENVIIQFDPKKVILEHNEQAVAGFKRFRLLTQ